MVAEVKSAPDSVIQALYDIVKLDYVLFVTLDKTIIPSRCC